MLPSRLRAVRSSAGRPPCSLLLRSCGRSRFSWLVCLLPLYARGISIIKQFPAHGIPCQRATIYLTAPTDTHNTSIHEKMQITRTNLISKSCIVCCPHSNIIKLRWGKHYKGNRQDWCVILVFNHRLINLMFGESTLLLGPGRLHQTTKPHLWYCN